jgi:DNA-binding IclR family transcriptional regulator
VSSSDPLPGSYRTVRRVIEVLNDVVDAREPQRLVDLSKRRNIPLSSTQVIVRELVACGMLRQTSDKRYEPGSQFIGLAARVGLRLQLAVLARPRVAALVREIDEDVYLALAQDDGMVYVESHLASQKARLQIPLGEPRPLHATAAGQLFLAFQNPDRQRQLLQPHEIASGGFERLTLNTITNPERLEERLELIRRIGYAETDGESIEGIIAYCGPIFGKDGNLVGGITIGVPKIRIHGKREALVQKLLDACQEISKELGWAEARLR